MIYTTYFAQLRYLPSDMTPVSICAKAPAWYAGRQYKKLAPKYDFFMEWKRTHDNDYYIRHFNDEVLSHLSADDVVEELQYIVPSDKQHIALVCYEKPADFCHRHLVARWLRDNGYPCVEWEGVWIYE